MTDFNISFREIIHPLEPEDFFAHVWTKEAGHIPGDPEKFSHLFSWEELNRLLNMSKLWSDRSMKIILDGCEVSSSEYCHPGRTRESVQAMLPVPHRVTEFLRRGATIILDLVETLSPGIAAIAGAMQSSTGGATVCNAYCSWNAHQGFPVHFDTTDVIALHIEGSKTWRIYEGRSEHPVDMPEHNFASFSPEHHARAKGKLLKEVEMCAGHVLYLPRGQYHEALASSEASLHLSFGINQATGLDIMTILRHSLADEPLFRENLPHFDNPQTHRQHLLRLADRIHEILKQPGVSDQMRGWQRERALRDSFVRFDLPAREDMRLHRVRSLGISLQGDKLRYPGGEILLEPREVEAAKWIFGRDYFDAAELGSEFAEEVVASALEKLVGAGIVEPL